MNWLQVGSCNGLCLKYTRLFCSDIVCLCILWEASNETYFLKQISVLGLHLPAYLRCIFSWCDDSNPQLGWALEFAVGCKFSLCSIVHFNVLHHGSHRYQPPVFFFFIAYSAAEQMLVM